MRFTRFAWGGRAEWQAAKSDKPLKNKTKQIAGILAVAAAVAGLIAWVKINNDYLDEFFGSFRDMFRYISFHSR